MRALTSILLVTATKEVYLEYKKSLTVAGRPVHCISLDDPFGLDQLLREAPLVDTLFYSHDVELDQRWPEVYTRVAGLLHGYRLIARLDCMDRWQRQNDHARGDRFHRLSKITST